MDRLAGSFSTKEWWTADQPVFAVTEMWAMLALLGENGYDPLQVLAATNVDPSLLLDPAARLSLRQHVKLHDLVHDIGASSLSVLLGKRLHLSTFGTPGFAVLSSPSLSHAFATILRFSPLLNLKFPTRVKYGDTITISIEGSMDIESPHLRNLFGCEILKIISFLKDMLGASFCIRRVMVGGLDPQAEHIISQFSGASPMETTTGLRARIELDASLLSRPLTQAHSASHRRAADDCNRIIFDLRAKADLKMLILKRLRKLDVRIPTFAEIAVELHMSERTLRRRLEKSQTSYSRILDELRAELAAGYVLEADTTTEDIAERLGYSDAANFRHAFKRWTGRPPSVFRAERSEPAQAC